MIAARNPIEPLTRRGTMLGGRLDFYVLEGGHPVVVSGRAASMNDSTLAREVMSRCRRAFHFIDESGTPRTGVASDDFVDELVFFCADGNEPLVLRGIGRKWLREFIRSGSAIGSLQPPGVP